MLRFHKLVTLLRIILPLRDSFAVKVQIVYIITKVKHKVSSDHQVAYKLLVYYVYMYGAYFSFLNRIKDAAGWKMCTEVCNFSVLEN